jgi:hypothetical protein
MDGVVTVDGESGPSTISCGGAQGDAGERGGAAPAGDSLLAAEDPDVNLGGPGELLPEASAFLAGHINEWGVV